MKNAASGGIILFISSLGQIFKIHMFSGSTSCYTPCKLMTSSNNQYDITSVGRTLIHDDRVSYPDQFGNRYHYRYLMKLCSSDGSMPFVTVYCLVRYYLYLTGIINFQIRYLSTNLQNFEKRESSKRPDIFVICTTYYYVFVKTTIVI